MQNFEPLNFKNILWRKHKNFHFFINHYMMLSLHEKYMHVIQIMITVIVGQKTYKSFINFRLFVPLFSTKMFAFRGKMKKISNFRGKKLWQKLWQNLKLWQKLGQKTQFYFRKLWQNFFWNNCDIFLIDSGDKKPVLLWEIVTKIVLVCLLNCHFAFLI